MARKSAAFAPELPWFFHPGRAPIPRRTGCLASVYDWIIEWWMDLFYIMLVFFKWFLLHLMENTHITSHDKQLPHPSHLSSWYPKVPPNRPSNPGRRDQSQDCRATTTTDGSLSHFNGVGWEVGFPRFSWNPHVDGSENRGVFPQIIPF